MEKANRVTTPLPVSADVASEKLDKPPLAASAHAENSAQVGGLLFAAVCTPAGNIFLHLSPGPAAAFAYRSSATSSKAITALCRLDNTQGNLLPLENAAHTSVLK